MENIKMYLKIKNNMGISDEDQEKLLELSPIIENAPYLLTDGSIQHVVNIGAGGGNGSCRSASGTGNCRSQSFNHLKKL